MHLSDIHCKIVRKATFKLYSLFSGHGEILCIISSQSYSRQGKSNEVLGVMKQSKIQIKLMKSGR